MSVEQRSLTKGKQSAFSLSFSQKNELEFHLGPAFNWKHMNKKLQLVKVKSKLSKNYLSLADHYLISRDEKFSRKCDDDWKKNPCHVWFFLSIDDDQLG